MNKLRSVLLVMGLMFAAASHAADPEFFDQTLGDFSEELQVAKEQHKQGILLFFEMDECPFCHRMKTTILNKPEVAAYFRKHFLIYPVDVEGDIEITDFDGKVTTMKDFAFKQHRVRATPVIAFFDLDGKRVVRYTGATADAKEFMLLGEFVVSGAYKNTSFTRYKRDKRNESG